MNETKKRADTEDVYSILLAGGTGSRLWPVSRELYPKQLVKFIGDNSFVQQTIRRIEPLLDTKNIRIICASEHFHEIAKHMKDIGIEAKGKILCEPCGRNTAPALLYAMLTIMKASSDPVLCVFPADHVIDDVDAFLEKVAFAIRLAKEGYIVTFGITPHYPETGYGYVEGGERISHGAMTIQRFIEKPQPASAQAYLDAGHFFWNSGMFTFKASVMLDEFRAYQPDMVFQMEKIVATGNFPKKEAYEQLTDISIDHAIMEKTKKGIVLPSTFGWSDIGSWKSLYDFLPKDEAKNVIDGDVIANDTRNCFIMGHKRLIATNHIHNMIVVETPDSVFVSDLETSRDVKSIVQQLKEKGRDEYQKHRKVHHPWGSISLLEQKTDYDVFRLVIHPEATYEVKTDAHRMIRLSVLKGSAQFTSDQETIVMERGASRTISENKQAAVYNMSDGDLYMLEIHLKH